MPSPFPGMDPYIEEPSMWPSLHLLMIPYICEALQPKLLPKYVARVGERIKISDRPNRYIPDAMVVEPGTPVTTTPISSDILVADTPTIVTILDEDAHVPYLEIIYRATGDVVTVIELLSPSNKIGAERENYLEKQSNILDTYANLIEIDLLSYGRPTTLARDSVISKPVDWRYMVCVSRASHRSKLELYPVPLAQRLPIFQVPLRAADPDVVLDLPSVFNRCYDVGGYNAVLNYSKAPEVTLSAKESAWLDNHLVDKGLRTVTQ